MHLKHSLAPTLPLLALAALAPQGPAQTFGQPLTLTSGVNAPDSVHLADLDGDADLDLLVTANQSDKLYWVENLGTGQFGTKQLLDFSVDFPTDVLAADLDGDADLDIVAAYAGDDEIALFENLGGGSFLGLPSVSLSSIGIRALAAGDLDGDGKPDLISANRGENRVVWHRNQTGLGFGPKTTITSQHLWPTAIFPADLDGDGDIDLLVASTLDAKLAWYENLGGGSFGPQALIATTPGFPVSSVVAADLDGDGDVDVVTSTEATLGVHLAWHENLGGGAFGPQQALSQSLPGAAEVVAADLDRDGDLDIVGCSDFGNTLAWVENLGSGGFAPMQVISGFVNGGAALAVGDIGSTGWPDIVVASYWGDEVLGIKNLGPADCNGNGITDELDIASGQSLDCNGNGIPDECDLSQEYFDVDGDGQLDSCSPPALMADLYEHSLSQGVTQTFTLTSPTSGNFYLLLGSTSGVSPGIPVGSLTLPLNRDPYFHFTLLVHNSYPLAQTFGTFQPAPSGSGGTATAFYTLPPTSFAGLAGLRLHHAFLTLDAFTGEPVAVSNPVPTYVIP